MVANARNVEGCSRMVTMKMMRRMGHAMLFADSKVTGLVRDMKTLV